MTKFPGYTHAALSAPRDDPDPDPDDALIDLGVEQPADVDRGDDQPSAEADPLLESLLSWGGKLTTIESSSES